jgi:hypothetical protein
MANQDTQLLDEMIVKSRRKMLTLGGAALAGMMFGAPTKARAATTFTDNDILNFALNLEYLEANFYYQAAFGTTINVANAASTAAGAPLITLSATVGTAGNINVPAAGGSKVPFSTITVGSYAVETAVEEGKHVQLLMSALGSLAVAQPAINISASAGGAFPTLATAAGIPGGSGFSPYANDSAFLVGAYVFEDVGVTAYHGAASLLTSAANLSTAAGIMGVEAYHAGLVRTTINYLDPNLTSIGSYTNLISALRAKLALAGLLGAAPGTYDAIPDDYGLANTSVSLAGGPNVTATAIVDAPASESIAFARNTTQVLNIVTGGGAVNGTTVVSPATGVFFPQGLNGLFK